jgi:hypothetical protein
MDELGQLILGSPQKSGKREPTFDEIKAAKKSYSGANPQLQAEESPDELGQLILGSTQQKTPQESGQSKSILQRAFDMKQAAPATAASALDIVAGLPSMVAGTVGYGAGRLFGLSPEEATRASQKVAAPLAEPVGQLTRTAGTQAYQQSLPSQAMQKVGEFAQKNIVEPVSVRTGANEADIQNALNAAMLGMPAAGRGIGRGYAEAKAALPTVRVERVNQPGMQSGGAAAATNQAMLNEAIGRASPELASELKKIDPNTINPDVLQNYVKADQFGIKLTKGQATQDPNLISIERNERGLKPQLAEEYAQQNRTLANKAEEIKQRTAEGTFEPDYVANSERAIESFQQINKEKQAAIKSAYDELDKLGAGKIQVDSKAFGEGALKALTENEDIDFLPSTIKAKIDAYAGGKEMNFAQYENLRTQIARETRKAQRADDGNAVHALTIARSELEKLPLLNETADAKVVADKARSLAAQEFGLLDKRRPTYNPVYAEIVNGSADTSNFIPKVVIRSKNADFAKAMDMLKDNPDAIKQLRAGTLDYIISKSKDASGNFSSAKFNQFVGNLDVNKKLTSLFGEDAQQIKDLADVAKIIEAQPRGSFVSTANTTPAAAQIAKQYGMKLAAKTPLIGGLVEPAMQVRAERQLAKEVQETMRPGAGAGTKLKNLGKD